MSIEELKKIIFQNRCVFLNAERPCLSDDMSIYSCVECSDKVVNEFVEKIRADERAKVLDEVDEYLRELSYIKSGCGEWIEHHDAKVRAYERAKMLDEIKNLVEEILNIHCEVANCDECVECCETSALDWLVYKLEESNKSKEQKNA